MAGSGRHVLERDDYVCRYCGAGADTVDHILPRRSGLEKWKTKNRVAACTPCNSTAGDLVFEDFEQKKRYILIRRFIGKDEAQLFKEQIGAYRASEMAPRGVLWALS